MRTIFLALVAPAAFVLSAGIVHAKEPELRDDLISEVKGRANAFAVELARSEGTRGTPNVVVCPAAVRSCLGVATLFAAGDTRSVLAKAARLQEDRRGLEIEAFVSKNVFSGHGEAFEQTELFLDSDILKLKPGYEAWLWRYQDVRPESVSFADPVKALAVMEGRDEGGRPLRSEYGKPLPFPFTASDIAADRDSDTGMIVVSRSHFKRRWDVDFKKTLTREEAFHVDDGRQVPVAMMHLEEDLPCAKLAGALAVRIPFNASKDTIYLILPDEKISAKDRWNSLPENLPEFRGKFTKHRATVSLPRFNITHRADIVGFLKNAGAAKTLDRNASDFSAGLESVRPGNNPALGEIRQEAFLKIDETGAEAGSITGMSFSSVFGAETSPEYPKMTLRFDRPFLFVIERDDAVLFAGCCGKPASIQGVERDKLALHRVADEIEAFAEKRFVAGAEKLVGKDLLPLLKLADGRAVVFSWKSGGNEMIFGEKFIAPEAAFEPGLSYTLRIQGVSDETLKISRRLPDSAVKNAAEHPFGSPESEAN